MLILQYTEYLPKIEFGALFPVITATVRPPVSRILGLKNRKTGGLRNREASPISIHDPNILV